MNIKEKLETALSRRIPLFRVTDAFRLVNGAGDGMKGIILEIYGQHAVSQVFSPEWIEHRDCLVEFIRNRFNGIYFIVKDRSGSGASDPEAFETHLWIREASSKTVVKEHSLVFGVDLNDGLNTGLFLDMRRNRFLVGRQAKGRRVLNCFSYTASFGVYARSMGAHSVVNLDISRKALERARRNYLENGIEPGPNEFIRTEALKYLERMGRKKARFDLIILDPPSFSRYEKKVFSIRRDLVRLIRLAVDILDAGGILFVSTNFREMTSRGLLKAVHAAAGGRKYKKFEFLGPDMDFPGKGKEAESHLVAVWIEF
jgi:23S rRNA G2069 N7-methylase RlmK/C1962 C5-methylase RlmI